MPLEVSHGQFQNVRLLQLCVFVRRSPAAAALSISGPLETVATSTSTLTLGRLEDQRLEDGETLIDAGASSFLHQRFVGALQQRISGGRGRRRGGRRHGGSRRCQQGTVRGLIWHSHDQFGGIQLCKERKVGEKSQTPLEFCQKQIPVRKGKTGERGAPNDGKRSVVVGMGMERRPSK